MRTAVYTTLIAFVARSLASGEESVTLSDLSIHKQGSPVGVTIESVSFKVSGADADNLECSATNVAFPKPDGILRCGKSDYAFTLWAGESGAEFRVMVYHDVGDSHADLRGWSDIPTVCDNSHGTGPADEICTQDKPVTFKIDGPVGSTTRLLVPLQIAALVAPWNIGHIMKLCAYWVGYRASASRSTPSSNLGTIAGYNLNGTAATTIQQHPHTAHTSAIPDVEGTTTSHLFFAGQMSALTALGHALRPTEAAAGRQKMLRYFPGGPRSELNGFLVLTTTVLCVTALLHVLFAGLVTLLAALTSMEAHEIITPLRVPKQDFGRVLPSECLDTDSTLGTMAYSCGLTPSCRPENSANSTSLSMAQAYTSNVLLGPGRTPNPFNSWIWSIVDKTEAKIEDDSEVVSMLGDAISVLLDCTVTVYNVSYSVRNVTVVPSTVVITMADDVPSYVVADPLAVNFPRNQLYEGLRLAAVTSRDAAELASIMSVSVREMALAYISGTFEPLRNEKESTRRDVQLARLPVALVRIIVALGGLLVLQAMSFFVCALVLVAKDPDAVAERDALTLEARVTRR
ncbi:hypothetical protein ACJ41O_010379 [Fusarium nematophilum]